ncbi:hypothetical protein LCGC14_0882680 [marine sediment metagenome]|uniref:Uncharacterized protein n=1 Tax=marine sediment metagenome TaxID=412755 RepID=A0A0F9P1C2_9ZZZZ
MVTYFDDDTSGSDILSCLGKMPEGKIHYATYECSGVVWYFFSDKPITKDIMEKELNINQSDCKHDWTDVNNKCEDCGHQTRRL